MFVKKIKKIKPLVQQYLFKINITNLLFFFQKKNKENESIQEKLDPCKKMKKFYLKKF